MTSIYSALNSDNSVAVAGWYPSPRSADGNSVEYWDGSEWGGEPVLANRHRTRPADLIGCSALWLVLGGFGVQVLMFIVFCVFWSLGSPIPGILFLLGQVAIIAGIITGFIGLARGRRRRFKTPQSVAATIVGSFFVVSTVLAILGLLWIIANVRI